MLSLVRNSLLDALKIEVGGRLSISMLDEIEVLVDDMKLVIDMVSQAVILNHHLKPLSEIGDLKLVKFGTLEGGSTVQIISSVVEETRYLKKVLPVGVIVGSLLTSLRKYFVIAVLHDEHKDYKKVGKFEDRHLSEEHTRNELYDDEKDLAHDCSSGEDKMTNIANSNNDGAMIGAVAAALGATALFARQQIPLQPNETQCGYFILQYMRDIIEGAASIDKSSLRPIFAKSVIAAKEIDEVHSEWVECI